jgi:hypothetical protein
MRLLHVLISLAVLSFAVSCEEIEEYSWCKTICHKLRECSDNELGIDACADRCQDAVDDGSASETDVEDCSGCVDDHSCRELSGDCRVCDDVLPEFTSRTFD